MTEQSSTNLFRITWFSLLVPLILVPLERPAAQANPAQEQLVSEVTGVEKRVVEKTRIGDRSVILWRDLVDLKSRDLFYGIGGEQHAPPTEGYSFIEEDLNNTAPKFVVTDSSGVRWKVKLGPEARGEVAAARLVWAAGYFTDEDYYLPQLQVKGMPQLKRGKDLVSPDGVVTNVRMEREIDGQKKTGSWKWKSEGASTQRDFNGLKIMMALINNWDLKDVNNSIYLRQTREGTTEYIYAVGDLGASFGQTHLDRDNSKSNLELYEASAFIEKVDDHRVRLATPGSPTPWLLVKPKLYFARRQLTSVTSEIPREHARWMGELLSGLSGQQMRDAFRAGGFSTEESDRFAKVVERRIEILRGL